MAEGRNVEPVETLAGEMAVRTCEAAAELDALIVKMTTVRTTSAWVYKEQLREILERNKINVVGAILEH